MHYYTTGLTDLHEENAAEMRVIAGVRMAVSYPDDISNALSNALSCCDITHRPQLILEGAQAPDFIKKVLALDALPDEGHIVMTHLCDNDEDIESTVLLASLSQSRFFMILDAIDDLENKDKITNWMADEMYDDMSFTILKDHTLIALQGDVLPHNLFDQPIVDGDVHESDSCLYMACAETHKQGVFITVENEMAPVFWTKLIARKDTSPIGVHAYEQKRAI